MSHPTPTKAFIQGAAWWNDKLNKQQFKRPYHPTVDIFDAAPISRRRGWAMLNGDESPHPRTFHNDPFKGSESRGRPPKISLSDLKEMDRIIRDYGWDGRILTWQQLGEEAGVDAKARTIKERMGSLDYHKCIACKKGWRSQKSAKRRVFWAKDTLQIRPDSESYENIRYSDEMHAGWGPQYQMHLIRRPGERYCIDCIQYTDEPAEKDRKRQHCWGSAGYEFKSDITFYDSGNSNGKMTQRVYIDTILEPIVKTWIQRGHDFYLEEDNDSGHGPSPTNIVRTWKKENNLKFFFNCPESPDLAPIENCWIAPKQELKKVPHWEDSTVRELIYEGWAKLHQPTINEWIHGMPQRLKDVIAADGQMTGH